MIKKFIIRSFLAMTTTTTTTKELFAQVLPETTFLKVVTPLPPPPKDNENKISTQKIYRWPWPHGKTSRKTYPRNENDLTYDAINRALCPKGIYDKIETFEGCNQYIWIRDINKRPTRLRKISHNGYVVYPYLTSMGKIVLITIN